MVYEKTQWKNGSAPGISADKLNKIENGIYDNSNNFFENVSFESFRDEQSNTYFYITKIPHKDEEGNIIEIKRGFGKDDPFEGKTEISRDFFKRKGSTVVVNASTFDISTGMLRGINVFNGQVFEQQETSSRYILGIKEDNTLTYYEPGTRGEDIVSDGSINALVGFAPVIVDGEPFEIADVSDVIPTFDVPRSRQIIAQMKNKDILILTCDGLTDDSEGMDLDDLQRILIELDVDFAYMLDGGGSTQTVIRGTLKNKTADGTQREVPDFLYVGEQETDREKDFVYLGSDVGNISNNLDFLNINLGDFNKNSEIINDANDIVRSGFYWVTSSSLNIPDTDPLSAWGIICFSFGSAGNLLQFAIPFSVISSITPKRRRYSVLDESWTEWV